jgi:hypothetical protein
MSARTAESIAEEVLAGLGVGGDPEWDAAPDLAVMRLGRREPPALPHHVFGPRWSEWIATCAEAAACPPDYVATGLLASASALIGHARWVQATPGWREPPHLWLANVGDSGTGKSGGADALNRDVLPEIERRMLGDFPERLAQWKALAEADSARHGEWQKSVKESSKGGFAPPMPPKREAPPIEPQPPRLRQTDVTIERLASILADAAPKGVVVMRDEIAGWLLGLNQYNDAGRAFWIEAFGGRPYRIERVKLPEPLIIPRLAVSVHGSIQPEKLAELFNGADDGLLARFLWVWPRVLPFRLSRAAPPTQFAIDALDRLRLLDLRPGEGDAPPKPIYVPLADAALPALEAFARDMQTKQEEAGGLLRSAYGKARGVALRLSLVLAFLRWCSEEGMAPPPAEIPEGVFLDACDTVSDYFLPMAERVYGDAAASPEQRDAATLARWVWKVRPEAVHVRTMQRETRLPGLVEAAPIHAACARLIEAGWLKPPARAGILGRPAARYSVNPVILEAPR